MSNQSSGTFPEATGRKKKSENQRQRSDDRSTERFCVRFEKPADPQAIFSDSLGCVCSVVRVKGILQYTLEVAHWTG